MSSHTKCIYEWIHPWLRHRRGFNLNLEAISTQTVRRPSSSLTRPLGKENWKKDKMNFWGEKNLWIPKNMKAEEGLSRKHPAQAQDSLLAQCSMYSKRYWCLMSLTSFSLSLGNKKRLFINYISQIRKIKYQGNFLAFMEKKVPCISGEKHDLQTARHSGNTTLPHIKSGDTGKSKHLNHSKKNHPWSNTWLHRWTSKEGGIQEPKEKQELCKTFN